MLCTVVYLSSWGKGLYLTCLCFKVLKVLSTCYSTVFMNEHKWILSDFLRKWWNYNLWEAIITYHLFCVNFSKGFVSGALGLMDTCTVFNPLDHQNLTFILSLVIWKLTWMLEHDNEIWAIIALERKGYWREETVSWANEVCFHMFSHLL